MLTFYKRFSVVSGFLLLLIVLASNAYIVRRQLGTQIDRQVWVLHSQQVLLNLERVESLLTDAETGQRGFLYTGNSKYLDPYQAAISQIDPQIENLAALTADNPRQQPNIAALRTLSKAKLAELAQTISLYQSGQQDEARQVVLLDVGLTYMADIRQVIARMNQEEQSLSVTRMADYERGVRLTIFSIYGVSFFAALGLIALAWYILREMDLRESHALELRTREEWFRVTLTSIGDAVIATDPHGKVTFLNPVAESLTGTTLESVKGKDIHEVFPIFNEVTLQSVEDPVKKVIALGQVIGLANHTVLQNVDGTLIPIEDSAAPIWDDKKQLVGVVLVFHDVTKDRQSQAVMRRTDKLATAARLSATVAHEINNPLEAVVNLIYIAKTAPDLPPDLVHQLTLAEHELDRVAHITRQTLGFYRESSAPETIEMPELIDSVLKIYSNKLKTKNISVALEFGLCLPIHGVPGELKQVFSNLIANAVDAVDHDGTIRITGQCVEDAAGSALQIVIEDDGPGIAEENVHRIFEPFFTTKQDVGTGLGLWVTKEIVDRHGGSILVRPKSDDSGGAAFTISLPVVPTGLSEPA